MIIKCKMCGGDMEISSDQRTGTCEYCGSTMTLPRIDDEQRAAAFNRGNHFRRIGEFDKALAVYEGIVREDENDAEAHWCCALCRFGIEYVKDPASGEYLPTCHRASFDSFLEDVDYKAALEHADVVAKAQYQKDGEKIAQVQRGILSISQREQPFDVFICYKESDERGNRTVDSTLAQEIYYQLTDQGRRVFFARITLEDKAGQEYEPYIFAALHSAKVMVVVGTKPEYLNSVWVRNEWSRYLALMKHDRKCLLIPCYRDMDPYDLPEQLSVLQSYDMSRIGFIQDLIRGIAKVLDVDKKPEAVKETIIHNEMNVNLTALLKRGRQMLEDKNWEKADEFFDQALNVDAECGEAFFGKTLASIECRDIQAFIDKWAVKREIDPKDLEVEDEQKDIVINGVRLPSSLRLGEEMEACPRDTGRIEEAVQQYRILGYLSEAEIRKNFKEGKMRSYISAVSIIQSFQRDWTRMRQKNKNLIRAIQYAKGEFAGQLQDSFVKIDDNLRRKVEEAEKRDREVAESLKEKYEHFLGLAEKLSAEQSGIAQARREADYLAACVEEKNAKDEGTYLSAAELFEKIGNYKDCISRAEKCRKRAQECRKREEEQRREEERMRKEAALRVKRVRKKRVTIGVVVAAAVAIAIFVNVKIILPSQKYNEGQSLMAEGNYAEAYSIFDELQGYKDVDEEFLKGIKYEEGQSRMAKGDYEDAYLIFEELSGYEDVDEEFLEGVRYEEGQSLVAEGNYAEAYAIFEKLQGYKDVDEEFLKNIKYEEAQSLVTEENYAEAYAIFDELDGYRDVNEEFLKSVKYEEGQSLLSEGDYAEAYAIFDELRGYKDAEELLDGNKELRDAYFAVGSEISFGSYEQEVNGDKWLREDIEWIVLAREGDNALLLSKYGLDTKAYNEEAADTTWEQSTIRNWLNSSFMDTAFTNEEQAAIIKTKVDNSQAEGYSRLNTSSGNNTEDQVFLLSYKEAFEDYFTSDEERICTPTTYADWAGSAYTGFGGGCRWWLRSPGEEQNAALCVEDDGSLINRAAGTGSMYSRDSVSHECICIRPALWVNLESDIF